MPEQRVAPLMRAWSTSLKLTALMVVNSIDRVSPLRKSTVTMTPSASPRQQAAGEDRGHGQYAVPDQGGAKAEPAEHRGGRGSCRDCRQHGEQPAGRSRAGLSRRQLEHQRQKKRHGADAVRKQHAAADRDRKLAL